MSCGLSHRHGLDLALLWLWCRLSAAVLIQPLAWELLYAVDVALKGQQKKKKKRKEGKPNVKESWDQTVGGAALGTHYAGPMGVSAHAHHISSSELKTTRWGTAAVACVYLPSPQEPCTALGVPHLKLPELQGIHPGPLGPGSK